MTTDDRTQPKADPTHRSTEQKPPSGPKLPSGPPVHELTRADLSSVGVALAKAFATDPVWEFLCDKRFPEFEHRAPTFFAAEARNHLRHGGSYVTADGRAAALWGPPHYWRTTVADLIRLAPGSLKVFGTKTTRALSLLSAIDKLHPTEAHWYLGILGTDPDVQGKGYGSAVLRPVLDRCDREGLPAYLESSKEMNVPFYERHGFAVTDTIDLADGRGPRLWTMWREPIPPEG